MLITKNEFEKKYQNNELQIAFIGMSNIGKSWWAEKLKQYKKFKYLSVDLEISKIIGKSWPKEMAKWMGYPYEKKYSKTQKRYLELENKITKNCKIPNNKNFILDTTGSFVHLNEKIHKFIKENFLIIEFDASKFMLDKMMEKFFLKPKTIVWGDFFKQKKDELPIDALRRSYPKLLNWRIEKFRELADIIIPGEITSSNQIQVERFWEILLLSLPK